MENLIRVLLVGVVARMCGGGFGAQYLDFVLFKTPEIQFKIFGKEIYLPSTEFKPTMLPEIVFGAIFGYAAFLITGSLIYALLTTVWSYLWMETGHGIVLGWGNRPETATEAEKKRTQFLSPVVDWLADRLGIQKVQEEDGFSRTLNYCRLFMAVKGLLIGLPVLGLPMIVLWPLSYEVGARLRGKVSFDSHALAEVLSGVFAGATILLSVSLLS